MEETSNEETTNLVSTVERLTSQVQQLQNIISRRTGVRSSVSLEDQDGSGDEGSDTSKRVKVRQF